MWILSFFPTPCGYGLCLLFFYYPIIFSTGLLSGILYYKLIHRIKINKAIFVTIIILIDFTVLSITYPSGEYHPLNQWKSAKIAYEQYDKLVPSDLFKSIENRNYLLTTAIDEKFRIPDYIFELNSCIVDSTGSCEQTIKQIKFYVLNDSLITSEQDSILQLHNGLVKIEGQLDTTYMNLRISTSEFGTYKQEYDNFSSNLGERGTGITGLSKDTSNIRVIIWKEPSKFEYKFTKYFGRYLKSKKAGNNTYE
jgi:hypothetical protein